MLKNKVKLLVLLTCIIMLISTLSFATNDIVPGDNARTTEGDVQTTSEETAPVTEGENNQGTAQPTPEIYNGDLYLFDNNVVMDKYVDGNVFIFGRNVEITGRVNGSLFVFGDKVTFSENSYIVQSIYACANELNLNGAANDLYAAGNIINMNYNSFMIRDLRVGANTFNFKGGAGRDAFVEADNFNFETTSGSSAIVYGDLNYSSNKELELSKELVQGEIHYSNLQSFGDSKSVGSIILDKVMDLLETILFTVVVFLLIAWLAPKFIEDSKNYIGKPALMSFGIGLLAFIVAIFVSFALLFSYIGISLAFAIFALFMLMMSISFAVTTTCITFKAKEKFNFSKKYLTIVALVVVTLILWVLEQIPYVGTIVSIIVNLVGFGTLLSYIFKITKKDKVVESK
ncbi:MAG: hypothetical protein HFJ58_02010 [Clostridia bacterium]|nr:hypothetical protein [Clostridia bacterium]